MTNRTATRRTSTRVTLALLIAAAAIAVRIGTADPVRASASVTEPGYIEMADGTLLHYTLTLPASAGRFPVILIYGPYNEGNNGTGGHADVPEALLANGYAVLGVNIRGTGCSGGTFDLMSKQAWEDGAAVIEWAARQSWSDGNVGMWGLSYPGMSQLGVAAERPKHLDAIAPFHALSSVYRDVGYPGGIFNPAFAAAWSIAFQPGSSYSSSLEVVTQNQDPICAQHVADHTATGLNGNTLPAVAQHPFEDEYWAARAPGAEAARIDVPSFNCVTWQDDEASPRETVTSVFEQLNRNRTWIVVANGWHGQCGDTPDNQVISSLVRFFDRFVKGDGNGFERSPRVQIWHEAQNNAAGTPTPRWITTAASWQQIRPEPVELFFRRDGRLSSAPPS